MATREASGGMLIVRAPRVTPVVDPMTGSVFIRGSQPTLQDFSCKRPLCGGRAVTSILGKAVQALGPPDAACARMWWTAAAACGAIVDVAIVRGVSARLLHRKRASAEGGESAELDGDEVYCKPEITGHAWLYRSGWDRLLLCSSVLLGLAVSSARRAAANRRSQHGPIEADASHRWWWHAGGVDCAPGSPSGRAEDVLTLGAFRRSASDPPLGQAQVAGDKRLSPADDESDVEIAQVVPPRRSSRLLRSPTTHHRISTPRSTEDCQEEEEDGTTDADVDWRPARYSIHTEDEASGTEAVGRKLFQACAAAVGSPGGLPRAGEDDSACSEDNSPSVSSRLETPLSRHTTVLTVTPQGLVERRTRLFERTIERNRPIKIRNLSGLTDTMANQQPEEEVSPRVRQASFSSWQDPTEQRGDL